MRTINERFVRQSFLGADAQPIFERAVVGLVGLGGGGSHVEQQLAHIGFLNYEVYDHDVVEASNYNRLIGVLDGDVAARTSKVEIATRVIKGLQPTARVGEHRRRWQDDPGPLRGCDLIFGCVDTFAARRELEVFARRYMIPLIDIGMDIHQAGDEPPRMAGQVILSLPGGPCMTCIGFLTEEKLAKEAALYGAAGGRPQVVWPNGVLASTAVGIAVDLLTNWTRTPRDVMYLSYDGNDGTIRTHVRLQFLEGIECPHYPASEVGDPIMRWSSSTEAEASVH